MEDNNLLKEIRQDYKDAKEGKKKPEITLKKEKKPSFMTRLKKVLIVTIIVFIGVAYAAERYVDWRAEHQWQVPVVWIGLVKEIKQEIMNPVVLAEDKEPMTDDEIIDQYHLSPVIHSIYMLESTRGKNDACKDEGKFNGYGYAQNKSMWKCYDSFEEVTERVNYWLEDRLAMNGNNITEAICYYNTGIQWQDSCGDYSANFWSIVSRYF